MPIWVYTLTAHIPKEKNYDISFYDTRIDNVKDIKEADLFLFSGMNQDFSSILFAMKSLKQRYPKAKTIIGGPIAWSFNQAGDLDLLKDFDHIFVGDGEEKIEGLLDHFEKGKELPHIIKNEERFDLGKARPLNRSMLNQTFDRYYGVVVEVSRGCPFLCEFCDIRIMADNNRSHIKSPDLIVQEVEHVLKLGKTQFVFACDNFIGDQKWAEEVVDKLIEMVERTGLQPRIYTWLTINLAKLDRLMGKMRRAGFELLFIGVESFNVNSLIETAKVQNTARALTDDIRNIQSFGFIIVAGLIFGFDTDEDDCFDITLKGLRESGLLSGDPSFLTALPGTPLYRRMQLSNRLRKSSSQDSSTSTGGVKYQTNIKYLLPKERLLGGFLGFVKNYNNGKFQLARLQSYFDSINEKNNFVPMRKSTGGFGSLSVVLRMIFANPKSILHLINRLTSFVTQPSNIYYGLKGVHYVWRQKKVYGRGNQLQFWLFSWSNYVMKYKSLKASEIDIESVDEDFDYNNVIPPNYREAATEKIPKEKIDAQTKATLKGLTRVVEKNTQRKSA